MKKRLLALFMAAAMVLGVVSGCSNPDGKKLLEDAAKKEDVAKGMKYIINFDIVMNMSATGLSASMGADMKGDIEISASPKVVLAKMNFNIPSVMNFTMDEECYVDIESNTYYFKNNKGWRQAKLTDSENPLAILTQLVGANAGTDSAQMNTSISSLFMFTKEVKTKGKKKFNDVQCYEIDLVLNPEAITAILNMSMAMSGADALGDLSGTDAEMLSSMFDETSIRAYVGTKDGLLHGIEIDMGKMIENIMNQAQQSSNDVDDVKLEKSVFNMTMITDYKDDSLQIPSEAKDSNVIEDADALMAESELLKLFNQQLGGLGGSDLDLYDDLDDDLDLDDWDLDSTDDITDEDAPRFDSIRMLDEITETGLGEEVDSYAPDAEKFYVAADVVNVTEPITVYMDWYQVVDGKDDHLIDSAQVDMDADNIVHSNLAADADAWPEGLYYVEFTITKKGDSKDDAIVLGSVLNEILFTVD